MTNFTANRLKELLSNPKQIRNVFLVPDSSSTLPFLDRLISQAGITIQDEDEKSDLPKLDCIPNTSLYYESKSEPLDAPPYLINLLYSKNCKSLLSEIISNQRLSDGALFAIDYIGGLSPFMESMLRHVVSDNMKQVLVINNIYRAISEFKQDPELIYQNIVQLLYLVNIIRSSDPNGIALKPEDGNVAFEFGVKGSWVFTINKFSSMYSTKLGINDEELSEKLWGNHYFDPETKEWTTEQVTQDGRVLNRGFVEFILKPIIKLTQTLTSSNEDQLNKALAEIQVELSAEEKTLQGVDLIETVLSKWINSSNCLLEMIVTHLPSPLIAQAQRIDNLYEESQDGACAVGIRECNPKGPLMMFVSKLVPTFVKGRFFAIARVFSGTVSAGQKVQIMGPNYKPGKKDDLYRKTIQRVVYMTGSSVESMDHVPCGTIVGLVGVDPYIMKTATISDSETASILKTRNYQVQPVIRVAVQTKMPEDLPKLIEGLNKLSKSDPLASVIHEESGDHIIAGLDEAHLQTCIDDLQNKFASCELMFSNFSVKYRETVTAESSQTCLAKSANKHNRFYGKALPITESLAQSIEKGEIGPTQDNRQRAKILCEEFGWDTYDARRVWAFGPEAIGPNIFVDTTKGVQFLSEVKDSATSAFQWSSQEGVLCEEPWRQIRINLEDVTMMVDVIHRGGGQVIPTVRRMCYACELTAEPRLLEPVFLREIIIQDDNSHQLYQEIQGRRGQIVEEENIKGTNLLRIIFYLPAVESFGFDSSLKLNSPVYSSSGYVFNHWELVPGNPLDTSSKAYDIVGQIRKMKGLKEGIPALDNYLDRL